MQSSVFIPPSPNWYGSQLSSVQGNELAYCAQNAIVLLDIEGGLGIKDIIGGYSSRTTCVIHVKDDCGGLFLVTSSCRLGNQVFVTSTGLDRICTLWNVPVGKSRIEWSQAKIASRCVGLGGHPTSICITRDSDRLIGGIGCGDGTIRIGSCVSMEKILRDDTMTLLWKGIPAPVVVVSWYPTGHEVLAFGCEDGTVGMVNMATKKVQLGISRHQMAVATLVWIPQDDGMFLLQSWCTAGVILTWPHHEEIFAAADVASKDYRTIEPLFIGNQDSESPISCIVALHAGCDGRVVIGHTDGLINMCQCTAGLPRILWEYQPIPDKLGTHDIPSIIMVSACGNQMLLH
eukprot:jgi/Picre1/34759/NNA_002225.t1